jgi:hypothetical protein
MYQGEGDPGGDRFSSPASSEGPLLNSSMVEKNACNLRARARGPGARRSQLRETTSSPTSTRSVFERSPMIRFSGDGSSRTSVGMATIWSRRAS